MYTTERSLRDFSCNGCVKYYAKNAIIHVALCF